MSEESEDQTIVSGGEAASAAVAAASAGGRGHGILSAPKARLICTDSSQIEGQPSNFEVILDRDDDFVVGRDEGVSVPIRSRKLSRKHARVFVGSGNWGVEDLQSTNGVMVNGQRVSTAWLRHGDEVKFGPISFRFQLDRIDLAGAAAPAAGPVLHQQADATEDESERTMAFGSGRASGVLLEAMSTQEDTSADERDGLHEQTSDRKKQQIRDQNTKKTPWGTYVFLLLFLVAAGAGGYYYSTLTPDISLGAARSAARDVKEAIEAVTANARADQDFTDEVDRLETAIAELDREIARLGPQPPALVKKAELEVLAFERRFAMALPMPPADAAEREAAVAAIADAEAEVAAIRQRLEAISDQVPADGTLTPDQESALEAKSDLVTLAEVVLGFRRFTVTYGSPDDEVTAAGEPPAEEIRAVFGDKETFTRLRNQRNSDLAIDYRVLQALNTQVENNDILIINTWQNTL